MSGGQIEVFSLLLLLLLLLLLENVALLLEIIYSKMFFKRI
jgi:hypothetical protein